jgi:cytochrome c-type biogenesis protein CcmE
MVLAGVAISATLALRAFQENLLYFFSPTQVVDGEAPTERSFRIGGLVLEESVKRQPGSLTVDFVVTDFVNSVPVQYSRVLPDLFQEGKGVVARGSLTPEGLFLAEEVLAKHDENYMAPEVAEALAVARESQAQ